MFGLLQSLLVWLRFTPYWWHIVLNILAQRLSKNPDKFIWIKKKNTHTQNLLSRSKRFNNSKLIDWVCVVEVFATMQNIKFNISHEIDICNAKVCLPKRSFRSVSSQSKNSWTRTQTSQSCAIQIVSSECKFRIFLRISHVYSERARWCIRYPSNIYIQLKMVLSHEFMWWKKFYYCHFDLFSFIEMRFLLWRLNYQTVCIKSRIKILIRSETGRFVMFILLEDGKSRWFNVQLIVLTNSLASKGHGTENMLHASFYRFLVNICGCAHGKSQSKNHQTNGCHLERWGKKIVWHTSTQWNLRLPTMSVEQSHTCRQ